MENEPKVESTKITYNKLVRDRIPEIIAADNATCDTKILHATEEYLLELANKLVEEAREFGKAESKEDQIKELADVLEIIKTLMNELEIAPEEVEAIRLKRRESRGGFDKKIFLISTEGGNYGK